MTRMPLTAAFALIFLVVAASPAAAQGSIDATSPASRGSVLPVLYVSFGALQAVDGYTTAAAIRMGGREINPLLGGAASSPAAIWSVKGGVTAASILVAERLWKQHHRTAAIVTMVASNGIMAAVAAKNASVLRALQAR